MPIVAGAQTLGTITGSVKDASGAVLPGVSVEVASPALIEKVRSAVTDGTGLYRIVNLPPGIYSVTFTLQGFNTVRREQVEVSPSFTATIDADMRVGNIQETVTVTGESPIVDVQSAAQTRSVDATQFKELPSSGSWIQMAALIPAVRAGNVDVGGVLGDQTGAQVEAHGSRPGDGVSLVDGLRIGNMYLSSNLTNMSRWTLNRVTVSGGIRVDLQNESTEAFTATPHRWIPNRNFTFAAVENVPNWKDVNPRVSVAYDLFGDGRTAVKASASRGVQQDSIGTARLNNPATTVQTQTNRTWGDANGNFIPDCDLTIGTANGECGPWLTPDFGSARPGTRFDPAIMDGWGVRPWNWEFSTGIQHEIVPRLSVSFGYFRRVNGNFQVTDNEALSRTDFTQYSVTVPTDSRLPNSGQTIGGLFDQNAIVAARNVVKDASTFGEQLLHWDGVDVTLDARLRNGLLLQGGVSTGKTTSDNCDIVDDAPEVLGGQSAAFCHQETPYLPQYKALASYTLPWYGVRVGGTFQSLPGPQIVANNIYNNANRVTTTSLGRAFTLGQANVNVIQPGTRYGDRLNQIDLRLTKIVNVGRGRVDVNVDFYNAFNSDAVIAELGSLGPVWRRPLTVIQPRFVKFSARWDF